VKLVVAQQSWPIAGSFTIARGSKTSADVIVVTLTDGKHTGQGEAVPYARYDETMAASIASLESLRGEIETGLSRQQVLATSLPFAARNALDCALWDLEAKQARKTVAALIGMAPLHPMVTAYTLSLDSPDAMAQAARLAAHRPLLKLKLGAENDAERLRKIRTAAPNARLIVDANEGWTAQQLPHLLAVCAETAVELIEQPLPANDDEALRHIKTDILLCADESAHGVAGLQKLHGKYGAINIKLDKTGGLTAALDLCDAARAMDFKIMVGCMLATSLAMAPAQLIAQAADYVDLDGPLLLAKDRAPSIRYDGSLMHPAPTRLWG
jgi:L-Ala-D/L-Glu epimerase